MKKIFIKLLLIASGMVLLMSFIISEANEEFPVTEVGITVTATNGGKVYCGDENWSALLGLEKERGTELTLEAVEHNGKFIYWKDEFSGKIISDEMSYTFTLTEEINITALFLPESWLSDYGYVTFADINGKILQSNLVEAGSSANEPDTSWIENPGYELVGWESDEWENVGEGEILLIRTKYEKREDVYTLSVTGGISEPALTEFGYDDAVVITADLSLVPKGKVFAGWRINGEVVSFDKSFSLRMGCDVVAEAVYADEREDNRAFAEIIDVDKDIYSIGVSILMMRNLPSDYELIESGLLMSYDTSEERITIDTAAVIKGKTNLCDNTAMYRYNKNLGSGVTLRTVPYIIYRYDGELYITYGTEKEISK